MTTLHKKIRSLSEKITLLLDTTTHLRSSKRVELKSLESELRKLMYNVKDFPENQVAYELDCLNEADSTVNAILKDSWWLQDMLYRCCFYGERDDLNNLKRLNVEIRALNKSIELLEVTKSALMGGANFIFQDLDNIFMKLQPILAGNNSDQRFAIYGIGGVGKTTLAKRIYDDLIAQRIFEGFAWINVPRDFITRNVLLDIYFQLVHKPVEEMNNWEDIELVQMLYELQLSGKYLIVLDNLWDEDIWTCLTLAFPSYNSASKLLVTTRNTKIADTFAEKGIIYTLSPSSSTDKEQ